MDDIDDIYKQQIVIDQFPLREGEHSHYPKSEYGTHWRRKQISVAVEKKRDWSVLVNAPTTSERK